MGSTTYSFDGNGNETGNSAGLSLAYNAQDQTTSATPPGGSATGYRYTDAGQTQRVSAGSTAFQSDVTGLSVMTTVTGTTYFTRLPDGTLLSERTPSGTDYYLIDGLGSVLAVANSAGSVVDSYSYDPFGNATSATEQVANPFRFDGQYLSEGDYGVSLLNDCKYGHDVKGHTLRLTLIKSGVFPDPQADQGPHELAYALLPQFRVGQAGRAPGRRPRLPRRSQATVRPRRAADGGSAGYPRRVLGALPHCRYVVPVALARQHAAGSVAASDVTL